MSGLLLQKILVCGKRIREIQLVAQRPFYFSFLRCSRSVPRLVPVGVLHKGATCLFRPGILVGKPPNWFLEFFTHIQHLLKAMASIPSFPVYKWD